MPRQLTIDPITRIEGHASVEIYVDDANRISNTVFKVMDFRGFESFLQGMQIEMMPVITARICGTCPVTHHLAASRAIDKVFGAKIPRSAELQRNIMNLGALVSSHATHFFALAGPDLLLGLKSDPAKRNIIGMAEKYPVLSKKALRLRSIGQRIVELVGGRGTHPVASVAGGMATVIKKDTLNKLRQLAAEGLKLGRNIYATAKTRLAPQKKLLRSLPLKTNYLGTVNAGNLDFYEGELRLKMINGHTIAFNEDDWTQYLSEHAVDDSYGKHVSCKTESGTAPYRVGPLARLNCVDRIDTPNANEQLEEMRHIFGHPCHQTVMYHYTRMIELLYAVEKIYQLVQEKELLDDKVMSPLGTPQDACAHVEAPRGVLIHDYKVDGNGIITQANLLVATQQNFSAINATIGMSAQAFIQQPDDLLLNAIEFGIRCYDPCLSCATHRMGEMKLKVDILQSGKLIRRVTRSSNF
jgi:coenzyme F420-reducing hydrogenase alpha subunit